mgnify:CR=1 FL=1
MSEKTITDGLFALKDENYRRFHAKLIFRSITSLASGLRYYGSMQKKWQSCRKQIYF